jgi:hypothetical protein
MRLPFLQVSSDAFGKARELGAILGCGRHRAMSMMLDLWRWALELESSGKATGLVEGKRAADRIAGAVEWDNTPSDLAEAMCEVGLLERMPDGYRVRGVDRYDLAFSKQEHERERKASWRAAKEAKAALSPSCLGDKAGTSSGQSRDKAGTKAGQSGTKRDIVPVVPSIDVDVDVDVDVKKLEATPPYARVRAEGSPLRDRLSDVFSELRGSPYSFSFECEQAGKRAMQLSQGEEDEIVRRWRNALSRTRYPQCDTVRDLVKHWNSYATEQREPPVVQFAGKPQRAPRAGDERAATIGQPCVSCGKAEGVRDSYGTWMCGPCADHSDAYWQKAGGAA